MIIRDSYPTTKKPDRFDPTRTQRDEMILCPPTVDESDKLTGYVRGGGCTVGCGACCEALVVPINEAALEHDDFSMVNDVGQIVLPVDEVVKNKEGMADWEHWLNLHEVYLFQSSGGLLTAEIPIEVTSGRLPTGIEAWVAWLEKVKITVVRRQGQLSAYIPIACTKLVDGMCSIVGTPEHPKMCSRYPRHPMDIEGLDFCTYTFIPLMKIMTAPVMATPKRKKGKRKKNNNNVRRHNKKR